jgi:hypothetical protein
LVQAHWPKSTTLVERGQQNHIFVTAADSYNYL